MSSQLRMGRAPNGKVWSIGMDVQHELVKRYATEVYNASTKTLTRTIMPYPCVEPFTTAMTAIGFEVVQVEEAPPNQVGNPQNYVYVLKEPDRKAEIFADKKASDYFMK